MTNKTTEQKLEEVATKSAKLIEQTIVNSKPKLDNLLTRFNKWLDSKLVDKS